MAQAKAPHLSERQKRLFEFLKERSGQSTTEAEILSATGWKPASWKAYFAKGHYHGLLTREKSGSYQIRMRAD